MNEGSLLYKWNERCESESKIIGVSDQIHELCNTRDRCGATNMSKQECDALIEFVCTN
jgi:hypothetical protein